MKFLTLVEGLKEGLFFGNYKVKDGDSSEVLSWVSKGNGGTW